jgi:hypothetical protein
MGFFISRHLTMAIIRRTLPRNEPFPRPFSSYHDGGRKEVMNWREGWFLNLINGNPGENANSGAEGRVLFRNFTFSFEKKLHFSFRKEKRL